MASALHSFSGFYLDAVLKTMFRAFFVSSFWTNCHCHSSDYDREGRDLVDPLLSWFVLLVLLQPEGRSWGASLLQTQKETGSGFYCDLNVFSDSGLNIHVHTVIYIYCIYGFSLCFNVNTKYIYSM